MLLCLRQKLFKNIFQRRKFPFFDGQRAPQTSITYTEGRQFEDLHDSKSCNKKELENISQCTIKVLYKSLSIRMTEVIENHGGSAHH